MTNLIPANEYCLSIFDGTHDTPKPVTEGKLLITSKHISGGSLDSSSAYLISEKDYLSIQKRSAVSQWDILFSMIGSVGEVYLERNASIPYAIKNMGVFSCKSESKAKWLYYYLLSPAAKTHIQRYLNGAVQKFLPLGALRNFPVPAYNETKESLVKVLSTIDAKIDCNNRINAELKSMAKMLYDYWFIQFDFPNADGKPYKTSGGAMVYSEELKRSIPIGWANCLLGDHITFKRGISYKSSDIQDSGIPFLNLNSFSLKGEFKRDGTKFFNGKYKSDAFLNAGDLVIAITDVTRNADIIGKAFVLGDFFDQKPLISCDVASISSNTFGGYYLEQLFNSNHYHSYIKYFASGTLVLHLNLDGVSRYKSIVPERDILSKFETICKTIFKHRDIALKENFQLNQLRDWLLPMLMNDQVTTS